jgi:hypothetical protein
MKKVIIIKSSSKQKSKKGKAVLEIYEPPIPETCCGDVLKYVSYISDFDRSYKIVSINNVLMVIVNDDKYPIIINEEKKEEFIQNHEMTRKLVNNIWMNRYR